MIIKEVLLPTELDGPTIDQHSNKDALIHYQNARIKAMELEIIRLTRLIKKHERSNR